MSESGDPQNDTLNELIDELDDLTAYENPDVLLFDGDEKPVVARVNGEHRLMSSSLIYARRVTLKDLRAAYVRRGEPSVVPLWSQSHRFDRGDFLEVADA